MFGLGRLVGNEVEVEEDLEDSEGGGVGSGFLDKLLEVL